MRPVKTMPVNQSNKENTMTTTDSKQKVITITIIVAALGYFVDIYDLLLFLIVGKKSLVELYPEWAGQPILLEKFQHLLDLQMLGMLIGGVLWGVIGDKKAAWQSCLAASSSTPSPICSMRL